jgi:hypothetical protein
VGLTESIHFFVGPGKTPTQEMCFHTLGKSYTPRPD